MRLNLFGGPGSGKSTMASELYASFKKAGLNVELVNEYVKAWAYQGRMIRSFDQFYIFGKQMHAEDRLLQSGVQHLVSDSPLLLQCYYAWSGGCGFWKLLVDSAAIFDATHPSVNVFLDSDHPYVARGRYETAEEAREKHEEIFGFVSRYAKVVRVRDASEAASVFFGVVP